MDSKTFTYKGNEITVHINDKFNRLTVKDLFYYNGKLYCTCECECGTIIQKILVRNLLSGNTKSCGCLNRDLTIERNFKHGYKTRNSHNRLYNIWNDMNRRCTNPNRKGAKDYVNKGIKVCEDWKDFSNFNKWALENGYSDELTIERKDNSKGYNPENCIWISKEEQSKNRTTNHYITFNNETKTLTDWAKKMNINRTTLTSRLKRGWSIEKALTTPLL